MIDRNDLERLNGMDVVGTDGDKIGSVDAVYLDEQDGHPTFAQVNTGLFGLASSFVPLQDAEMTDDAIRVPYTKDEVKDAPNMDPDGYLEPEAEDELYRHYGMDTATGAGQRTGTATSDRDGDATGMGTSGTGTSGHATDDDAMTRSEEELHVGTSRKETGTARLRKYVVTDHVQTTVPVQREEVRVEREPITDGNVDNATGGPALTEDEHEVTLHAEEAVVEKRTVPKERVSLEKETHVDEQTVEEDVDKERIDLAGLEESREPGRRS